MAGYNLSGAEIEQGCEVRNKSDMSAEVMVINERLLTWGGSEWSEKPEERRQAFGKV